MRTIQYLLTLALLCVPTFAQLPKRAELLAKPKYVDDVPHKFQTFTEAELRADIKIVPQRNYAVFGYNTPELRLQLPKIANSSYSQIEFPDPTLVDAAGKPVTFEVEHGGYNDERFSDEIRFTGGGDAPVDFAHATGTVKLKYPLSVKTQTFTPASLGAKDLAVKLNGPFVSFGDDAFEVPDNSGKLRPIRAYDAAGHQLEPYGYSETSTDTDGVMRKKTAFYGNVARLEIDTVGSWAELGLPYDVTPAPLLPAGHEGEDPESYKP